MQRTFHPLSTAHDNIQRKAPKHGKVARYTHSIALRDPSRARRRQPIRTEPRRPSADFCDHSGTLTGL